MTGGGSSVAHLQRIAAIILGRSLSEVVDPGQAGRTAAALGAATSPPIEDARDLDALADLLTGVEAEVPPRMADSLAAGLGLPGDCFGSAAFAEVEAELLSEFLRTRGVVRVQQCRGGGRLAVLGLLDLVDQKRDHGSSE